MIAHLRHRQLLLVLDNFEQLLAAPLIAELRRRALTSEPPLTSRCRCVSTASIACPCRPLPYPAPARHTPAELEQYAAGALFVARCSWRGRPSVSTRKMPPQSWHICVRLDGIPLALELAAARVNGLSVEYIAARLDGRLSLWTRQPGSDTAAQDAARVDRVEL